MVSTFGSSAVFSSVVSLPDGKVLAAGTVNNGTRKQDFLVARYNVNGTLDTTFGGGTGRVFTDFGREERGTRLLLTGGGKFVVVGSTLNSDGSAANFAVARYKANGTLDNSFSGDGKVTTDFSGSQDIATAAVILSDGKLMVIGSSDDGGEADVAFARYNAAGALDTSFGGGTGKRLTHVAGVFNHPTAAAVLPEGQILVAIDDRFTLARFTGAGALSLSFGGGDGWVRTTLLGEDVPSNLAVLPSGKILMGGYSAVTSENGNGRDFALARYNSGGTLDTSFGGSGDGFVTTDFNPNRNDGSVFDDVINALNVQPNGKILAVGVGVRSATTGQTLKLAIGRYNAGGTLDPSFSGDGKLLGSVPAFGAAVAMAPGGKTVVAGFTQAGKAAVARYNADFAATASIAGTVYNDLNGSGTRNTGEGGLAGWQVFVDSNHDGFYTPGEVVATTDSSGNYKITGLLPGTYRVREVRKEGWNRTQPAGIYPLGFYDVTLSVGQAVTGRHFGNKRA